MSDAVGSLLQVLVPLFAASSMMSVGLAYSMRQILDPLRNGRGVMRAISTNFVVVPLLAFFIARVLSLEPPLAIGLTLIGCAAGAPFVVKLTQVARGDIAFSATLLVLLVVVTILYMPLAVPMVVPDATVDAFEIGRSLALTMLLPLVAGHVIEGRVPRVAARLQPTVGKLSSIALFGLIATTFYLNFPAIREIGFGAILAAALLTAGAFLCGYFLINRKSHRRSVMGLASAQRNIAAATVVAQSFGDSGVLVMVVVTSLVDLAILFPIAFALRRRADSEADADSNANANANAEEIRRIA